MTPDHQRYADWDAAYVLGALSVDERRQYEQHLATCPACTSAVAAIAGMPGLLGQVDADDVRALLVDPGGPDSADPTENPSPAAPAQPTDSLSPAAPPADLLPRLELAQSRHRNRRRRAVLAGFAAAAVIGVGAVVLPQVLPGSGTPAVSTSLTSVSEAPLSANVRMFSEQWGTRIEMHCSYLGDSVPSGRRWEYALFVVAEDGQADEVSSWSATAGSTAATSGSTRLPVEQIVSVQVRSMNGQVLLSADLP